MTQAGRDGGEEHSLPVPPIDKWEGLLEGIAKDVSRIRSLVTMAWWSGWLFLAVVVVLLLVTD